MLCIQTWKMGVCCEKNEVDVKYYWIYYMDQEDGRALCWDDRVNGWVLLIHRR